MSETDIELIREANETMSIQLWILGGIVVTLLAMLVYFTRTSFEEIKLLLKTQGSDLHEHDKRLLVVETTVENHAEEILHLTRSKS